jgi:pimeloyl-ACP methyl ester carboxylesterase
MRSEDLVRSLQQVLAQVPERVLRARLQAASHIDVTSELGALEIPTLYLRASEDTLVPRSAAECYARAAVRGKVEVIAGPHFLLQCVPSEAAKAIEDFVLASSSAA